MHLPGLYFPYIHVRDDEWLKVASLYWPSIRRLVPRHYPKRDSAAAVALADAGILIDEDPREQLSWTPLDLVDALKANAERLTHLYSIDRAVAEWDGRVWSEGGPPHHELPQLAWIHVDKISTLTLDHLVNLGLATVGRPHSEHPGKWVGVHPALAGAYMTTIAVRISQRAGFHPLTDQSDLSVATPAWDVGAAIELLLGRDGTAADTPPGMQDYVMLAMQYAIPRNLTALSVDKVVQCRQTMAEELVAFREYVKSQQAELRELARIPGERRRLEAFTEQVCRTIEIPLGRLERGLQLLKLEPTRALLLAGSFVPPAALGTLLSQVGTGPAVASAVATLTAVGNAWWQVKNVRSAVRATSPVGYLLDVRDRLTPSTLRNRVRKLYVGTAGRPS